MVTPPIVVESNEYNITMNETLQDIIPP
jgi:hypothetical protein